MGEEHGPPAAMEKMGSVLNAILLGIGIIVGIFINRIKNSGGSVTSRGATERDAMENDEDRKKMLDNKPSKIPQHIAVIMDGNRRYGRSKHADPLKGHWAGGQTLIDFVQWCMDDGVSVLTVYAFSTENWSRAETEVSTLMTIFAKYANSFQSEALSRNVKVNILSTDYDKLPVGVQTAVRDLEKVTAACTGFILNICLSYGGRGDILTSCKQIAKEVKTGEILSIDSITEETITARLGTCGMPDPDIMIRTSGEYRLSNFLLWQSAYSELFFIDKYWPEVSKLDLRRILYQYEERSRRFGK